MNSSCAIRARREQLEKFQGLLPESQGHNLALTALCVPSSLDSKKATEDPRLRRYIPKPSLVQGYLAHKKQCLPWALQQVYAYGPMAVLGGVEFLMSEVPLYRH